MARPGIAVEFREGLDHSGPEGIQVQVTDKLEEVRLFLYGHRFVPVLEEVPDAFVAPVKGAGIPSEEAPHGSAERPGPRPDEEMGVVWQEGPSVDGESLGLRERREARDEVGPIPVVAEDRAALQAADHDVMKDAWRIQSRTAWHGDRLYITTCRTWQRPAFRMM
jgi:hypothetical protein